jgi:hypothetical protein
MSDNSTQKDIITYTQDFWEPRLGYRPTPGQAEIMILNVTNLFKLLLRWEAEENEKAGNTQEEQQQTVPIFMNPRKVDAGQTNDYSSLKGGRLND